MRRFAVILVVPAFASSIAACAGTVRGARPGITAADNAGALAAQRDWWRAFATADTAYLQAHTTQEFSLTLSSGRTFDRAAMLAQAATHVNGGRLAMRWSEESVGVAAPPLAVATTRVTETDGPTSATYRYLTVLDGTGGRWRVAAAQSTRELAFTPRVPVEQSGALGDFAGGYRTPRGLALRVEVRGAALAMVEPSGVEIPLEPIGPGIFEFRQLSPSNGMVRMVFTRDASGRVAGMTRLINGEATTFPRIP
ncbi:MAG TPA: nuclear transport factor 2 family protein [Longimicrobium sp.]|nr:nuclear transport factor 2 family protein [Longimicrobium sp.]